MIMFKDKSERSRKKVAEKMIQETKEYIVEFLDENEGKYDKYVLDCFGVIFNRMLADRIIEFGEDGLKMSNKELMYDMEDQIRYTFRVLFDGKEGGGEL